MRTAAEIRAYIDAATDAPWVTGPEGLYWPIAAKRDDWWGDPCEYQDLMSADAENAENDATFCVNAREDLPRLLDAVQRYREAGKRMLKFGDAIASMGMATVLDDTVWLEDPMADRA